VAYTCLSITELSDATLRAWRGNGLVFLVGSYASVFPPTNLPFGRAMSQALWERILTKSDLDSLKQDLDDVPFEAIMQCYPNRAAIRPIIQELFSVSTPNAVHRCLAAALKMDKACGLITTCLWRIVISPSRMACIVTLRRKTAGWNYCVLNPPAFLSETARHLAQCRTQSRNAIGKFLKNVLREAYWK
jgi:hypothetical protein